MLHFDLSVAELKSIADELGATPKQTHGAMSRALRRTEATMRRMSARGLPKILQLRTMQHMRTRLKSIRVQKTKGEGVGLWYGLNPIPVSSFKGRAKNTSTGASFNGQEYAGAFVGKSHVKNKRTIFKRVKSTRLPVAEQNREIHDDAIVWIEDEVFAEAMDIFWQHFRRDLAARIKYKIEGR